MSEPHGAAPVLDASRHRDSPSACCAPVAARQPLSCDRIVDAALRLVDLECLADLSMRRLGGELGVEAMSLYRYFPSKSALLDAVACRALEGLELPDAEGKGYLIGSSFWGASCAFEPCAAEGSSTGGVSDADLEFGLAALIAGLQAQVETTRASG
jgi:AcrR family transcriptional regulator